MERKDKKGALGFWFIYASFCLALCANLYFALAIAPDFGERFADLDLMLPWLSQVAISVSFFFQRYALLLAPGFVGLFFGGYFLFAKCWARHSWVCFLCVAVLVVALLAWSLALMLPISQAVENV